LVKPTVNSGSRGVQQNLFYNFWTLLQVFTNFESLNYFLPFKTIGKTIKNATRCQASNRPTTYGTRAKMARGWRHGGLPRAAGRKAAWATTWWPSPAEEAARDVRKWGARHACSRRGDALDGGAVGAGQRQGAAREHRWGPGVAPGRRSGGGAHPSGGST
jgi:hypothetical protein